MASSESVTIPIDIPVDVSSVETAKGKLREAESALRMLKEGAKVPTYIEFQTSEAKAAVKSLTTEVRALEKANKDAEKSAAALAKASSEKSAKDAVTAFQFQKANAADDAAKSAAFWKEGGDALASGAKLALGAALAIGAAGIGLVASGLKFGIENTAQRQKNTAVLDRLTRGQGAEAEEFSKKLAGNTGVTEDKAMERVKGLIQAGFNKEQTGAVFTAAADIGEVKGEGKAELFIKTLEKVTLAGTASEKSVKALLGAGVARSDLLEGLKKAGETTEQVEARLKGGKVAAEDFTKAATAAVQKDIGGIAGKGLDAMFNRAKIAAGDLFDNFDISGIEELGSKITDALGGSEGATLKEQITGAANSILDLTKNITKADIKSAFQAAGEAATTAAAAIKGAAGFAADLWNTIKQVRGSGSHMEKGGGSYGWGVDKSEGDTIEHEIEQANKREQVRADQAAERAKRTAATEEPVKDATAGALAGGAATGKAYADGLAKGIDENAGKPAAAAASAMGGVIEAGNAKAKIKSPSQVAEESGKNYDAGWEKGISGDADKPARAAADMAGRTTRAGQGGSAFGGSGGASGGGDVTITIGPFNLPPGSNEATKEAARAGIAMMLPELLAALRTVNRVGGVTGGPSLP